jgi:mono/diheme cytochrome c family protein
MAMTIDLKHMLAFAIIASSTFIPTLGSSQEIGNAKKGAEFADVACYQCHAVRMGQKRSPNHQAPSFSHMAADPRITSMALRVWFQTPHPTMPNLVLREYDKENLIAYILSLKR